MAWSIGQVWQLPWERSPRSSADPCCGPDSWIRLRRSPEGVTYTGAIRFIRMRVVGVFLLALLAASCGGPSGSPAASSPSAPAASHTLLASPSPHFVAAASKQVAPGNGYPVVIDEVGLRPNESVDYSVTAQASADYQCVATTSSGLQASGPSQHVMGPVSAAGTFLADGTGEVNRTLTLAAPAASNTTCPAGSQLSLWRFSFTEVSLLDRSHQVQEAIPDFTGQA